MAWQFRLWLLLLPAFPAGAEILVSGRWVNGRRSRSRAMARRAAIDAAGASWTIAGRGRRLYTTTSTAGRVSHVDLPAPAGVARRARGGPAPWSARRGR